MSVALSAITLIGLLFLPADAMAALRPAPTHGFGAVRTILLGKGDVTKCVAASPDGAVWALSTANQDVLYEVEGKKVVAHFALPVFGPSTGAAPCMAFGADGDIYFDSQQLTTAKDLTARSAIVRFSPQTDRTTIFSLSDPQAEPTVMVAGPTGVWFIESHTDQIAEISASGSIRQFATGAASVNEILPLADGDLWFDARFGTSNWELVEVDNGFRRIREVAETVTGGGDTGLMVGPNGRIWTSASYGAYQLVGSKFEQVWNTDVQPTAWTVGPDGSVWFTSAWFGCLASQEGFISAKLKVEQFSAPGCANAIVEGPPGLVYFADDTEDIFEVAATGAGFDVPIFVAPKAPRAVSPIANLATPGNAFSGGVRTVVNVTITVVALVALTFPAQLFNNTFEENYDEIVLISRRRTKRLDGFRSRLKERKRSKRTEEISFGLVLVIGSLLAALRSPTFGFNGGSVEQFVATLLAVIVTIVVSYLVARWFRVRNHMDTGAKLRALPAGLVITILCVLVSRVADFQPGYLYGVIAGVVFTAELRKRQEGQLVAVGSAGVLLLSIVCWLLWVPTEHAAAQAGASFVVVILSELLATVFVGGITGLVISLLPLRFMPGYSLYKWHRGVWVVTLFISAFLLVEVLLRPAVNTSHSGHVAWVTAAVLFVIFGIGSLVFREFFARHVPEDKQSLAIAGKVIHSLWEKDGQTTGELAASLKVSDKHIEAVIDRLERARWIKTSNAGPEAEGETLLHLTTGGKATQKGFTVLGVLSRMRLAFGLTEADRKLLDEHMEATVPALIK
jgi:streptogramin lyase/DNA-binding MarR family transcriptional regulator